MTSFLKSSLCLFCYGLYHDGMSYPYKELISVAQAPCHLREIIGKCGNSIRNVKFRQAFSNKLDDLEELHPREDFDSVRDVFLLKIKQANKLVGTKYFAVNPNLAVMARNFRPRILDRKEFDYIKNLSKEVEKEMILIAYLQTGLNMEKTAKLTGLSLRTIRNKLYSYLSESDNH